MVRREIPLRPIVYRAISFREPQHPGQRARPNPLRGAGVDRLRLAQGPAPGPPSSQAVLTAQPCCPRHGATVETEAGSQGTQNPNSTLGHDAHRCPSPPPTQQPRPLFPQPCRPRRANRAVLPKGAVETADLEERPPNDGPGLAPGTRVPPPSGTHRRPAHRPRPEARVPARNQGKPRPNSLQAPQSTVKHTNGSYRGTSRDFEEIQAFPSGAPTP